MNNITENYFTKIKDTFLVKDNAIFRFGSMEDGGYYLRPETIKKSKLLLSGGISSNLEFEYDIFRFNKDIKIIMIDPTVSVFKLIFKGLVRIFLKKPDKIRYIINALIFYYLNRAKRCVHLKIWLNHNTSLFNIAKSQANIDHSILLKLDIEGSEYNFLQEITSNLHDITAMVFEFHDLHKNHEHVYNFIKDCSSHFKLVHLNINPSGGFDSLNRPKCIEISLERL